MLTSVTHVAVLGWQVLSVKNVHTVTKSSLVTDTVLCMGGSKGQSVLYFR